MCLSYSIVMLLLLVYLFLYLNKFQNYFNKKKTTKNKILKIQRTKIIKCMNAKYFDLFFVLILFFITITMSACFIRLFQIIFFSNDVRIIVHSEDGSVRFLRL